MTVTFYNIILLNAMQFYLYICLRTLWKLDVLMSSVTVKLIWRLIQLKG